MAPAHLSRSRERTTDKEPLITVAIPHYKYPAHLIVALKSLVEQTFTDMDILVSDDASPDDSAVVVPEYLDDVGAPYQYYVQPRNLGYDGNVRFCLERAQGKFVLLLGNDDRLYDPDALGDIARFLRDVNADVAFGNYADAATGAISRRATRSGLLGTGPEVALGQFRSFSFVSGLLFRSEAARAHTTDRWDRSVYYQIYIASRIVAAGGVLAALDRVIVEKDMESAGHRALTYADRLSGRRPSMDVLGTGLRSVVEVTVDAVAPYQDASVGATARRVIVQVLQTSYLHWLVEYRRLAGRTAAIGAARDLWPPRLMGTYDMSPSDRVRIWAWYGLTTAFGVVAPSPVSRLAPGFALARRILTQGRSLR